MEPVFKYVTVEPALAHSIASEMEEGSSVMVLGGVGSGKFILRNRVKALLMQNTSIPIVELNFQHEPPLTNTAAVREMVANAAIAAGAASIDTDETLMGSLDGFASCCFLILSQVDCLAHFLVRQLLEEFRERATRARDLGKVVALIAGEYNLRDHVHGPASDLTNFVKRHYVLQGCGYEYFDEFTKVYFEYSAVPLPDADSRYLLWKITGGNADLMMAVVGAAFDAFRRRGLTPPGFRIEKTLVDHVVANGAQYGLSDLRVLRNALRLIPFDRDVWRVLAALVRVGSVELSNPHARPGSLVLSGLARRDEAGQLLVFSSPIMAGAARRSFDDRFFGDLYSHVGLWRTAFRHYRRLGPEERMRPVHDGDRAPALSAVRAAIVSLDKELLNGRVGLWRRFEDVCRYILGHPDAFIWQQRNRWELVSEWLVPSAEAVGVALGTVDSSPTHRAGDQLPVPMGWEGIVFAWKLAGADETRETVVLVGDFEGRRLVNVERQQLLREFVLAFVNAYRRATEIEEAARARIFNLAQAEIVSHVLGKLGVQIFDVIDLVRLSIPRLKALGYQRIHVALVDPRRETISRLPDPDDPDDIPAKTWSLDDPNSGVHPWAVMKRLPLLVPDSSTDPLTDKEMCLKHDIPAYGVVPILAADQSAVGTISIVRADHVVPSRREIEDFVSFGRVLHSLMEHAQRVALLQKSLDLTPEPHLIVDARYRLRYANERSAKLLGVRAGWREDPLEARPDTDEGGKLSLFAADIKTASDGLRAAHHEFTFPLEPEFRGSLVASRITNCLDQTIGAFVHVEDLTYVDRVLRALECVARAHDRQSALGAVLDASKILGHRWARLYLFSPRDPGVLESHMQFGLPPGSELAAKFEAHELRFSRPEGSDAWAAIDERQPIAFCYSQENTDVLKETGLAIRGSNRPALALFKDYLTPIRVMAPIMAGEKTLGCIELGCDEDLLPEHFHFLNVFFNLLSTILHLHLGYEDSARQVELARENAAKTSLALLSHNLATRIAGFSPIIALYEAAKSPSDSDLPELNQLLRAGYEDVRSVLDRAKEVFRSAPLTARRVDLFSLVESVLGVSLAGSKWIVDGLRPVEVDVDELQMKSALKEVIHNALDFADARSISVRIEKLPFEKQPRVRIVVEDRGPGVPLEMKERIFDDFFTHRPDRDPGTGLGLALTRRIVELHGGRVYENGEYGMGACFVLEFPQYQENSDDPGREDHGNDTVGGRPKADQGSSTDLASEALSGRHR